MKSKGQRPAPARDLYRGQFFNQCVAYAEATCDAWCILSAKHGLVLPDQVISPYELVLKAKGEIKKRPHVEMAPAERSAWAEKCGRQLRDAFGADATFVALMSKDYRAALAGLNAECPLEGLKIGERQRRINQLVSGTVKDLWTR